MLLRASDIRQFLPCIENVRVGMPAISKPVNVMPKYLPESNC